MSLGAILLIILILVLVGALPTWGHSRTWGYGPSGIVGVVVVILIILLVLGRI
jgi:hypothetical protein